MTSIQLTNEQARTFLLLKHGLIGDHTFRGKEGALAFIRQAGCIQFDPIDVCGRNADLVLRSRVAGYRKSMLETLLYRDRAVVDYFDKNLAIFPAEDWPCFSRFRANHRDWERSSAQIAPVCSVVLKAVRERGPLCAADLGMNEKVQWYWSSTTLARAALEHLYFCGELGIHHKKGTLKYYDLMERLLPKEIVEAPEPHALDAQCYVWWVQRRIGAVGMLWNKPSDAWLNIPGLKSEQRGSAFETLLRAGSIAQAQVQGVKQPLYFLSADMPLIEQAMQGAALRKRMECIAPLDCLLWDRNLIRALFGFDYKWEIYTPVRERKYGYYVLPLLYGTRFIGRVEAAADKATGSLLVKNLWLEAGVRPSLYLEKAVNGCMKRLAVFNGVKAPEESAYQSLRKI